MTTRVDLSFVFDPELRFEVVGSVDGVVLARGSADETTKALELAIADACSRKEVDAQVVQAVLVALRHAAGGVPLFALAS